MWHVLKSTRGRGRIGQGGVKRHRPAGVPLVVDQSWIIALPLTRPSTRLLIAGTKNDVPPDLLVQYVLGNRYVRFSAGQISCGSVVEIAFCCMPGAVGSSSTIC